MVIIIQRLIQKIKPGKLDALDEIDKKFDELESKIGFPPKKRYRVLTGALDNYTLIVERQWQSMSKMEKLTTKAFLDPELNKLSAELETEILDNQWIELLVPHPPFPKD